MASADAPQCGIAPHYLASFRVGPLPCQPRFLGLAFGCQNRTSIGESIECLSRAQQRCSLGEGRVASRVLAVGVVIANACPSTVAECSDCDRVMSKLLTQKMISLGIYSPAALINGRSVTPRACANSERVCGRRQRRGILTRRRWGFTKHGSAFYAR